MSSTLVNDADQLVRTTIIPEDAPEWVKGLMTIFVGLVTELKSLNLKVNKLAELESSLLIQRNTTDLLKQENGKLNARINALEEIVDNNEQHDRNINLLLHGVAENRDENTTDAFVSALSPLLQISAVDIERSHRLGPPRGNNVRRPRQIIVRFRDEKKKMEVYRSKKALKGAKLLLTENLTKWRQELFNTAKNILGIKNTWTNEGRIFTRHNNQKIEIRCENDIPQPNNAADTLNASNPLFG